MREGPRDAGPRGASGPVRMQAMSSRGTVAAGHPVTAAVGADVLRAGGTAVDAAIACCLASWACEPLLTGPGAGGYLLVAGGDLEPALLDFFVAAPSDGDRAPLTGVDVSFGSAVQTFHVGASSCGVPGTPAGLEEAARRWGTWSLADLAAPGARLARDGVALNAQQGYIAGILEPILRLTPEVEAVWAPHGRVLGEGDVQRQPELGDLLDRLGQEGAHPFYAGDLAAAVVEAVQARGGTLTAHDLASYAALVREPAEVRYRGRTVLTNPPPSAGGTLLALSFAALEQCDPPPSAEDLLAAMEAAARARTPEFFARLLGSTTHICVMDADGRACSVTCTNGEGSGIVAPGTGIHVNNIMGEEDLNPLGFFRVAPGTRMPSMMAPTAVVGDDGVRLALGSAGSNRIRSAILQVVVGVLDRGLDVQAAVNAPRLHLEAGQVFAEPGVELAGRDVVAFAAPNVFFGGVQAVSRDPRTGVLHGAGDPRRGGAVVVA